MSSALALLILSIIFHYIHAQTVGCSGNCQCPSSVSDITCTLICSGKDQCKDAILRCRAGDPCIIICNGENSCEGNSVLDGSDATDVSISCIGDNACKGNTLVKCGTASCDVTCSSSTSCDGTRVTANTATSFVCSGSCNSFASIPAPFHQITSSPTSSTSTPTISPTENPTQTTINPTINPTKSTLNPSQTPTNTPSLLPTNTPTSLPTNTPTSIPTNTPITTTTNVQATARLTVNPSIAPISFLPTNNPNAFPTISTTVKPTNNPSQPATSAAITTSNPATIKPSVNPTISSSVLPTSNPSETIVTERDSETTKAEETDSNESNSRQQQTIYVIGANPMWYIVIGSASLIICGSIVCCCAIWFYYRQTQAVLVENKQFVPNDDNVTSPQSGETPRSQQWNPYANEVTYKDADADAKASVMDGYILTVPKSVLEPGHNNNNDADDINNDIVIDTKGCDINESYSEPLPESDSDKSSDTGAKYEIVTANGSPSSYNQSPAILSSITPGIYPNMMPYPMQHQNGAFMPYVIIPQSSASPHNPHMIGSPPVVMSPSFPNHVMPPHPSQ